MLTVKVAIYCWILFYSKINTLNGLYGIVLHGNTCMAWETFLQYGLPCGLKMCSHMAIICNCHLQRVLIVLREKDNSVVKGSFSFGGALSDLDQIPQVHCRGWFTKKDAFFSMRCQVTFTDAVVGLPLARGGSRAGCVPVEPCLALTSLAVAAGCECCFDLPSERKAVVPFDLRRDS